MLGISKCGTWVFGIFNRAIFPAYCRLHPASSDQGYGGSDGAL